MKSLLLILTCLSLTPASALELKPGAYENPDKEDDCAMGIEVDANGAGTMSYVSNPKSRNYCPYDDKYVFNCAHNNHCYFDNGRDDFEILTDSMYLNDNVVYRYISEVKKPLHFGAGGGKEETYNLQRPFRTYSDAELEALFKGSLCKAARIGARKAAMSQCLKSWKQEQCVITENRLSMFVAYPVIDHDRQADVRCNWYVSIEAKE